MRMLRPKVKAGFIGVCNFPKKVVDPFYQSSEWETEIRPEILSRDKYRCVQCGSPAKVVDHIRQTDAAGNKLPRGRAPGQAEHNLNLRSLCRDCDNRIKEDHTGKRRGGGDR